MKKPKLIVHFGSHKTGSSSIQNTLFKNRDKLGQYSYIHFGVVNSSPAINNLCSLSASDQHKADANSVLSTFRESLNNLNGKYGIISAEVISRFTHRQISYLIEQIKQSGLEPEFIGYIREPVGYYTSMFQQTLKTQRVELMNLKSWTKGLSKEISYYYLIDRLIDVAGKDSVHIYPFERKYFPEGNVVLHFLQVLGIDPTPIELYTVNTSLSIIAIKALYVYRKLIDPEDSRNRPGFPLGKFITEMRDLPGRKFRFGSEIQQQIRALNFDYEEWVKSHVTEPDILWDTSGRGQENDDTSAIVMTEDDLMQFSENEINSIKDWAGSHDAFPEPGESVIEFVARMVQYVRTQGRSVSSKGVSKPITSSILKRLRTFSTKKISRKQT